MNDSTLQLIHVKLSDIVVLPQPRKTFHNIDSLADDIREHGLLQPPTITPSKRLLWGERRYRACKLLGLESIDVLVHEKDLKNDEILELQIAENVARDDLSWQERALCMLDIYRIKKVRGVLEGWNWGQREASALFKIQLGTVNYILRVAARLELELTMPEPKRKFWQFSSANEAYRMGILQEEEDRLLASSARITQSNSAQGIDNELQTIDPQSLLRPLLLQGSIPEPSLPTEFDAARERYNSNPLNTIPFDEYWADRQKDIEEGRNTVYISKHVFLGDSIDFMNSPDWEGAFDHIITDPPYAIDMTNLEQENQGMVQVDRVEERHDVDENLALLERFFPAAFKCTKDKAFVITFCDPMIFRHLHDFAQAAGFSVQRWPIIWRKVNQSSMNNCAHCNTTKDYEIAMFCHKPGGTFINKLPTSIFDGSNVEAKKLTSHPFAKPFEVTRAIVNAISLPRQRILDPFAGGGSIVIETLKQNRQAFAVEKEPHHFNSLLENVKREYYLKLNPKFTFK